MAHCDMEFAENLPATGGEDAELKQCSFKGKTWRCPNHFSVLDHHKRCSSCREKVRKYAKAHRSTEAGKATQRRYDTSTKGKASSSRYQKSEKGKISKHKYQVGPKFKVSLKKYTQSEKGQAVVLKSRKKNAVTKKASNAAYWKSENGKAVRKRYNALLINRLRRSLNSMVVGKHPNPCSFPSRGLFADNDDVQRHFESTFEPWMSFANHGLSCLFLNSKLL